MDQYERTRAPLDVTNRRRKFGRSGEQMNPATGQPIPPEQPVRFPDHYSPPEDAVTFTKTAFFDSAGNDANAPAGLVFQLPQDSEGVVRDFSRYINDMIAADVVTWQFRINGNPVQNWGAVTMFPRVVAFGSSSDDPYIFLPSGALIDILITNATGNAHKIGASFYGWFWPSRKTGV